MSVIAGNVVVAFCYTVLLAGTLFVLKLASGHQKQARPSILRFNSSSSPYWTLWKYLGWRYTLLAMGVADKQYLLMQLLTTVLFIGATLRINAVAFWGIAFAPIGIVIGAFVNEFWRAQQKEKEADTKLDSNLIKPTQVAVSTPEAITRTVFSSIMMCLLAGSTIRIAQSISNIGELNALSALVSLAVDQLAIRPLTFLVFLAGVRIFETRHGRAAIQNNPLLCHMLVSEYLRSNLEQRIIPDSSSSPPKKQDLSPSRVPKASASSRFEDTNMLFDMLKQRTSERLERMERTERIEHIVKDEQKAQKQADRVEDICLDDRNIFEERNRNDEDGTERSQKLKTSEISEEFLCLDLNKENLQATVKRPSKDRHNNEHDDLYLAENYYPVKHEQTLPMTITLSPVRQRKPTRSKQKRPNRVLVLTGDSPYLQYLPNMLKKQESENKLRQGKDKPNTMHVRSEYLNGGLKEIPR